MKQFIEYDYVAVTDSPDSAVFMVHNQDGFMVEVSEYPCSENKEYRKQLVDCSMLQYATNEQMINARRYANYD